MKFIALNLPQFHEIKENNEWWGHGFTEWKNLKRGSLYGKSISPLFGEYNMLDKTTLQMQYDLSTASGIYGFCYYHYWFKGKKLLEKPVENLLLWKDIPQKFCFCWANHSWYKSEGNNRRELIKQEYGVQEDWETHFEYLKPFFLDDRYIKEDNCPVFIIYNILDSDILKIMEYFNSRCKDIGFSGLHFVQTLFGKRYLPYLSDNANAVLIREPAYSLRLDIVHRVLNKLKSVVRHFIKNSKLVSTYSSKFIFYQSVKHQKKLVLNKPIYLGVFTSWNNTYRHRNKGYVITTPSKKTFSKYIKKIIKIGNQKKIEYCFINAWNEWAEGMVCEPDTVNGFKFLDVFRELKD